MEISSRKNTNYLVLLTLILLCFQIPSKAEEDPTYKEIPVGVILEMGSWVGKIVHSCINMALSDFYMANIRYKTRIVVHSRDTHGEPLQILSAALGLLEKVKVQAIIGSESTDEAKFWAALGDQVRIPILSLSPIPSSNIHPYFLQITQDETTQVKAIAAMAQSFGCKNVIVICEDTDNGRDMATFMTNVFQEERITITYKSLISTSASNEVIQKELHRLSNMHTKTYILHASHSLASHLFLNAKYLGMMDAGNKWIVTSNTMNLLDFMDDEVIESMQGVVGFKSYIPQSRNLHRFTSKWRKEYDSKNLVIELKEINAYAIWAYDAVSALAMAVENTNSVLKLNNKDLETSGSVEWGTTLLNQMLRISFDGLSGTFKFLKAGFTTKVLEIVNVMGKGEQKVGFWTKDSGFTKSIGMLNSSSIDGLKSIIWPAGVQNNPMHRMLQVSNKVLRIGLPVQFRSGRLLQVDYDPRIKETVVSGFCVDVLIASVNLLPYSLEFEFIPFINKAKVGTVNYNDLIDQVHAGEFDAAIGDITITANRSKYVDFTLPFTDLGVATLYRNEDASMWLFLKPLSSDLWVVSACFFILLGSVIWILEHQINEEFQGSMVQQIGTTLWFAFSTLFYAQRQKLQSNLSRFAVIVWLFVVLVLVSSYTATLSSLLTVEQIQLASNSGSIGYQYGSPVQGIIARNMNFKDTRLKPYSTLEDYAAALSLGSKSGGVDAIVDEIPYIKEFLAHYPSGYSTTVSEDITNGFGFAFPQGSPLAPEISRQIARLREYGTLKALENQWFGQQSYPQGADSATAPKILSFKGLRGLFLISGVSMAAALFISMLCYIHEKVKYFTYLMLGGGKLAFILRFLLPRSDITQ